jgi:subtilisin-like proprotein convertase family protein/N-acetylneuraminic acid mutarotase
MHLRRFTWILLGLLCLTGVWVLWQGRDARLVRPNKTVASAQLRQATPRQAVRLLSGVSTNAVSTNKFAFRLGNTTKSIDQLVRDDRAILLENALIDTRNPLNLSIPANLRAQGDPGAYIVQARGPVDNAFRAMLAQSGATIVSYIPNNAYLVNVPSGVANAIASRGFSVIPYEPYYKISSSMPVTVGQRTFSSTPMKTHRAFGPSLLTLAVKQAPLPVGTCLTLGLFSNNAAATVVEIEKLGGTVLARDCSPFGPVVRVQPPVDWVALARLNGVQIVEPYHKRVHANDLSRVTVGVSTDTLVSSNYMNLTGQNVTVEVNDSGIDAQHPDFTASGNAANGPGGLTRVIGDAPQSLVDTNGHGTHVAGIIAGNGAMSIKPVNVGSVAESSVSDADFRGKAPLATLYSIAALDNNGNGDVSDQYLQQAPALTNALISNNSWGYGGDNAYDLAAASYDAATRDALPYVTGSQPVLFVFAAGNDGHIGQNGGNGDNNGGDGTADTISSPGTAKNVITVGALEQKRNITNWVTALDGTSNQIWQPETDTSYQVADYSSRGNVGIGIEGAFGRFKPDVVAPGTFVVSTRSAQWATNAYYNPTNYDYNIIINQLVNTNAVNLYSIFVPQNTISVTVQIVPNNNSPNPFPTNMPIYVSQYGWPDPTDSSTYDFATANDKVLIPPDGPGDYLTTIQGTGFDYEVGNNSSQAINYDLFTEVVTTNDLGNYYQVLEGMNDSLGGYYRYESGTSMSAADVSGMLALMEDFFVNHSTLTNPSPALLKAMLINGARPTLPSYNVQINNTINDEGWGLINLPDSLPPSIQTNFNGTAPSSIFIQDQSPTNALATGDSQTFHVTTTNTQPLRITLAWTDPPGDPIAAIKLVNVLNLVVTNLDDPTNPIIYYGNDISENGFNTPETTNTPSAFDLINNVQNVIIPQPLGSNYTVTVIGRDVNVNAVSAQTNNAAGIYAPNVVQDYALVISCGAAFTVTATPMVFNPTGDQQITFVTSTNTPLFNQFVGANTPLMGTNTLSFPLTSLSTTNALNGVTNWQVTIGMTNQWHFYVVTNPPSGASDITNAAFVTFLPPTLSVPRMGVFADSQANATRPEADIDLYVSTNSALTNLDPMVISNCVIGTQVGASVGGAFSGASLGRGGTEFVVDTNSTPGQIYYIGVKSEDQMASEYEFIPIFSVTPFSQINQNGSQTVNGMPVPVGIPDGSPAHPGYADVFGLALYPMEVRRVVVTNVIAQQNVGDLVGAVNHNDISVILMNHDSPNSPGTYTFTYDDSGQGDIIGSQPSDGPGSLRGFIGRQGSGVWILHEADSAQGFDGSVQNFNLTIEPHKDLKRGVTNTVQPNSWYYDYIDVPVGATNLTITVTNLTGGPLDPSGTPQTIYLYDKYGSEPTLTSYDTLNVVSNPTGVPPEVWGSVTNGPPLASGRYFVGIFNPSSLPQDVYLIATIGMGTVPDQWVYTSTGEVPILDDAVTTDSIFVPDDAVISSVDVGLLVQHPRISDLVFHLISPDGTRVLLMENRGGTDTHGAGTMTIITNTVATTWRSSFEGGSGTFRVDAPGYIPEGWHVDSGSVFVLTNGYSRFGGGGGAPYESNYYIDLTGFSAGMISTNIISTNIATTNVSVYKLTFAYAPNPDSIANGVVPSADILVDGNLLTNFSANIANTWADLNWQTTSYVFTAASPSTTLAFQTVVEGWGGMLLDGLKLDELGLNTNSTYLVFTENTNWTTTPIKFAPPPFRGGANSDVWHNSFEEPSPSYISAPAYFCGGWHLTSGSIDLLANGYHGSTAYEGNQYIDLNGSTPGTISTNITTIPGQSYRLDFAYARNPDGISSIPTANVSADGSLLGTIVASGVSSWASLNWQTMSYVFTATNSSTLLTFESTTPGSSGVLLDAVNLAGDVDTAYYTVYYLPEQPLDAFAGLDALGPWTLEIQDDRAGATNPAPMLAGWQLRFNFASVTHAPTPVFSIPNLPDINMNELTTLMVTNTATDSDTNKTLIYSLLNAPTWASIDTNGIITLSPLEPDGPGTNTITTVVAVYGTPSATTNNSFTVIVNEVNRPPVFLFPTNTTVFHIYQSFPFSANCVATDPDIPVNPLTFALVSESMTGLTVSTNGVINWMPVETGTNTVKISVTDTNAFALINKSFSVTNSFTIIVTTMTNPPTGPLNTGRYANTATLLPNGKVLVAGGYGNSGYLSSAELYNPATGTWTNTGSMTTVRYYHTATLLTNGLVLVAGGNGNGGTLASAELYDPATGTWTNTGSMTTGRGYHTATLLPNGKVLVAGGYNGSELSSAELYDPATRMWTSPTTMNAKRSEHTATLLTNGLVLVAGGYIFPTNHLSSSELYDPIAGKWTTTTGSMVTGRGYHTATLLPNGKVLVAGGSGNSGTLASAELYDPTAGTWTATNSLHTARYAHAATLLPNGQVLVAGGYGSGYLSNLELYDPGSGTWQMTAFTLAAAREHPTATLLASGQVLIAGGYNAPVAFSNSELYDPASGGGAWTATTNVLNSARAYHTATLLTNGQVLVAGGFNGGTNSELYNPASGTWTNTGSLTTAHGEHTATLLPSGKVLVAGGFNGSTNSELYNPSNGTWMVTGALNTGRHAHTATLLPNGKVLVAGGDDNNGNALSSAEQYDPTAGTWTPISGTLHTARYAHTATLLPNGQVLVAGGDNSGGSLSNAELYANGTWTATSPMTTARYAHTATLLPNGKVLVAGGLNFAGGWLSSAELYDPATGTWTNTGSLSTGRYGHTATLLPNGKVLITGGVNWSVGGSLSSSELYDPPFGTWMGTGPITTGRNAHTATLLPDGQVLVAGGDDSNGNPLSNSELYDEGLGFDPSWQPRIATFTSPLNYGDSMAITGSGFRGISEGSGGNTQDSPADYPLVQLRSVESGQTVFLLSTNWSTNSFTSASVTNLPPGWALITVFVNGIPSTSGIFLVGTGFLVMHLAVADITPGGSARLQWESSAGNQFQVAWTTDFSPPIVWTTNENIITSTDGTFTFTDPDAANSPMRFYKLIQLQ